MCAKKFASVSLRLKHETSRLSRQKSVNPTNKIWYRHQVANATGLMLVVCTPDIFQRGNEVVQNFCRNHNAVTVGAHFFGDTHHAPAGIALKVKEECLAVCNDFFCANDIVVHCN